MPGAGWQGVRQNYWRSRSEKSAVEDCAEAITSADDVGGLPAITRHVIELVQYILLDTNRAPVVMTGKLEAIDCMGGSRLRSRV